MANEPNDSFLEVDENRQEENKNMPNVKFKRGLQSSLFDFENHVPVVKSGVTIEDGTFYLTTDTNRLFVGNKKTNTSPVELVELNKSITTVATVDDLPTTNVDLGQFYYIVGPDSEITNTKHTNILAVWNGTTWIQVNPDTDTNDNDNTSVRGTNNTAMVNLSGDNAAAAETNDNNTNNNTRFRYRGISNGKAQYELVIEQVTSHISGTDEPLNDIIAKFEIDTKDIISNASQVDIDNTSVSNNTTTIKTTGEGSKTNGQGFTIAGTNGRVTLTDSSNGIVIDTPDYYINSPAVANATEASSAEINLGDENGSATNSEKRFGTVTVKAGEDLAINNTTAGEFTIYHKISGATAGQYGVSTNTTPAAGTGKIKVPNVTVDAQGHVTAIADQEITLPVDKDTKVTAVAAGSDGKITITPSEGTPISSGVDLFYNVDIYDAAGNKSTVKKLNQANLGEFYSKAAIDTKLQGLNAVHYKGTVSSTLPTSNVENGDSYLASTDFTVGSGDNAVTYHKGDLIIATGTEGSDGYIASPLWQVIASDSNTDTTYTFGTSGTSIIADPSEGSNQTVATFESDNVLQVGAGSTDNSIKYSHKTSGVTAGSKGLAANTVNLAHGGSFKVPYVTVDAYGHVTALTDNEVTLPDADLYSLEQNSTTPTKLTLKHNSTEQDSVTWEGSGVISVAGNASTKKITVSHNNVTRTDPAASTTTLAHNGTFTAITGITSNAQGHITAAQVTEFTLPSDNDTTYTLKSAALSGLAQGTTGAQLLLDSSGTDSHVNITSQSLSIVATPTEAIAVDLVWGTF